MGMRGKIRDRLGVVKLSPTKKSIIVVLDNAENGWVSLKSLRAVVNEEKPYAVIRKFEEKTQKKRL